MRRDCEHYETCGLEFCQTEYVKAGVDCPEFKPKILILPIKKKWFDMIVSGEKKQEYRAFNQYYGSRFSRNGVPRNLEVMFRNGYSRESPSVTCKVYVHGGTGIEEWGAEKDEWYFCLDILEIVTMERCEKPEVII